MGALVIQATYFQEALNETEQLQVDLIRNEIRRLVGVVSAETDPGNVGELSGDIKYLRAVENKILSKDNSVNPDSLRTGFIDKEFVNSYTRLLKRTVALREVRNRTLEQRALEEVKVEQLGDISRLPRFVDWLGKEKVGLAGVAVSTAGLITTLLIHARGAIIGTAKATSKVAKALSNIAKKGAPILVPILNAIATALSWGAKRIAWLTSHLWVLAIAAALMVYNYYTR
jgi:hypothetical protein